MNEATRNTLISLATSFVMLAASVPALASFLTPDLVAKLQSNIPVAITALSSLITAGLLIYKAIPRSRDSVLKNASQQPGVQGILTTEAIATSPALKDNPKIVSNVVQLPPPEPAK